MCMRYETEQVLICVVMKFSACCALRLYPKKPWHKITGAHAGVNVTAFMLFFLHKSFVTLVLYSSHQQQQTGKHNLSLCVYIQYSIFKQLISVHVRELHTIPVPFQMVANHLVTAQEPQDNLERQNKTDQMCQLWQHVHNDAPPQTKVREEIETIS